MQLESDARKIDAEPGWEITNECVEKIAEETSREGMMSVRAAPDSNGGLVYNLTIIFHCQITDKQHAPHAAPDLP